MSENISVLFVEDEKMSETRLRSYYRLPDLIFLLLKMERRD